MDIVISSRHVALSDKLRKEITEGVQKLLRFFEGLHDARVVVDQDGDHRIVELTVGAPKGRAFVGRAEAPTVRQAARIAKNKVEAQVRRLKERLQAKRPKNGASFVA